MPSVITDTCRGKHISLGVCILLRLLKDNLHKIKGNEFDRVDPLVLIPQMYNLHCHELPWKSLRDLLEEFREGLSLFLMKIHELHVLKQ